MKRSKTTLLALLACFALNAQSQTDFSGKWELRGKPGSFMTVSIENSQLDMNNGKLDTTYEINGPELVYTGTDGDEFHSKLTWEHDHFLFTVVEHERGKLIPATETWSLGEAGKTLKRVKQTSKDGKSSERISYFDRR